MKKDNKKKKLKKINIMLLNFIANKVNILLLRFPLLGRYSCIYFDITSRITHFFLFNTVVFVFLYFFYAYIVSVHFLELYSYFKQIDITNWKSFFAYNEYLGVQIKSAIFFFFLLFDIIITNTILVSTEVVTQYMKKKYHENILKDRGYNTRSKTLQNFALIAGAAVTGFASSLIADVAKFQIGAQEYTKSYREYVLGSNGTDLVPPKPLATVEVTETVKKVVDLSLRK
jgi:hypothetical protein